MACPQTAVPHILARAFTGPGDADPDQGFDVANDFQPDDPNFAVFNICDNTTLVKCPPCGAEPQAFHCFSAFRVFENTNAPFQPRAEPYIVDIIKCSDFDGFTPALPQYSNTLQIFTEICTYASTNGLPGFVVKLVGNNGHSIPIFSVLSDGCPSIPNVPLTDEIFYTVFINGFPCKIIRITADVDIFNIALCLNNFDYSSIGPSDTITQVSSLLCAFVETNCPTLNFNRNLTVQNGILTTVLLDFSIAGTCVPVVNANPFFSGPTTITFSLNNEIFKTFI